MWGPPGTGKTTVISRMADYVVNELNGVVVYSGSHLHDEVEVMGKATDGSFPLLVVMEDFEASVTNLAYEKAILAFLDGEDQVNNVVFLGTSNYPEFANERIFNRPSRFDTIMFVGPPEYKFRYDYILAKLGDETLAKEIAEKTKDFTIAHLKEVIICVHCLGQNVDQVVEKIRKMQEEKPDSNRAPNRRGMGFLSNRDDD
jgi:SpoVK/Ycf46/Vps4 family AAA+-type ATPase